MSSYFDKQYGGDDDLEPDNDSLEKDDEEDEIEEDVDEDDVDDLDDEEVDDEDVDDEGLEVDEEGLEVDEEGLEEDDEDDLEGGGPEDIESGEIDEEAEKIEKKAKRTKKVPAKTVYKKPVSINDGDEDEDDSDDDGELYLQKFDKSLNDNYILNFHPECALQNYDEILSMIVVIRDKNGIIVDDLHKTIPYLTKYERARILGQRAKQINSGSPPFVKVPENVIDGYIIAELELKEKKIPFIIRRPLPNGGSEYWSIKELEDISF
jgi:DNA-directed RNA polymerase I, II, and III subunit RPABC2